MVLLGLEVDLCVNILPYGSVCGSLPLSAIRESRLAISLCSSSGEVDGDGMGEGICGNIVKIRMDCTSLAGSGTLSPSATYRGPAPASFRAKRPLIRSVPWIAAKLLALSTAVFTSESLSASHEFKFFPSIVCSDSFERKPLRILLAYSSSSGSLNCPWKASSQMSILS
eukprot:scaffold20719_cov62-Phaeocystis_antarctica.AAC.3